MLINDNYVNLNYMMSIDVLRNKKQKVYLFVLKIIVPEHKCLFGVENAK